MTELRNKIVLLTGAAGGLGQEIASALLNEGCQLILTDLDYEKLEVAANSILHTKGKILGYFTANLETEAGCQEVFKKCLNLTSYIDILINNAGTAVVGSFVNIPDEKWERVMNVNIMAPMRLTKKFLPLMIERKAGHIVNIVSITGFIGTGALVPYSTSKFALSGFGEAIYNDVSNQGIKVTNMYPSFVRTKIIHAEQFGYSEIKLVPDFLIGEPVFVAKKLIKAIKKDKVYIYPGLMAKILNILKRLSPSMLLFLIKLLRSKASK